MIGKAPPPGYVYGPFWRHEKDANDAYSIKRSGKLRGRVAKNTHAGKFPAIRAYRGNSTVSGNLYFYTKYPPDDGTPPAMAIWRDNNKRKKGEVVLGTDAQGEYAEIEVAVVNVTCDRRKRDKGPPAGKLERRSFII